MVLKKKGAIYSVVALMLCVAVYLNFSYSKNQEDYNAVSNLDGDIQQGLLVSNNTGDGEQSTSVDATGGDSYFATARLSRQKARDEAVSILTKTVENQNASKEAKDAANMEIQVMADNAMVESRIENLVVAKGYSECVVFINDNGVNVIISKLENGLQSEDVAKIKDIVFSETNTAAEKIKIIETA